MAIITPARNEKHHLLEIFNSVILQSLKPDLWIIIDDYSSDGTFDVAVELTKSHDWIKVLKAQAPTHKSDRIFKVFEFGVQHLQKNYSPFDLIMKLDADTLIPPNFIKDVVASFRANDRLGIVSGINADEWTMSSHLRDNSRVYRSLCLNSLDIPIDGIGLDTVALIQARFAGWSTIVIPDLVCLHLRSRMKDVRYTMGLGRISRHLGYYPWYAMGRAALIFAKQGIVHALAFLLGYLSNGYGNAEEETKRLVKKDQAERLHALFSNNPRSGR